MSSPSLVNLLWTSGWDSTFRLIDLIANTEVTVQPWYVIDPDRRSRHVELVTMDQIREALIEKYPSASTRLLPTIYHDRRSIPRLPEVSRAFRDLNRTARWGPQYEWLAMLALTCAEPLELSIKADDRPTKRLQGSFEPSGDIGGYKISGSPVNDAHRIFKNMRFPLIRITKLEMAALANGAGFDDILDLTWFCQHPTLRGTACGLCLPCQHYREEGLGHRVPTPNLRDRMEFYAVNKPWALYIRVRKRAARFSEIRPRAADA